MCEVQLEYDVAVVGAGFGGIAAALELARSGARVALFENLKYPGGCASTFTRRKHRFESGATLFSGFDEGQLFGDWIAELGLDIDFVPLDPVIELRTETFDLAVPRTREMLIERFCALPGADAIKIRRFFDRQKQVADVLWELFDEPAMLPPFGAGELARHALRSPRYLPLVPLMGQTLRQTLERWDVADFEPLRTYLNAVCQITVQAGVDEVETPFALAAMDYFFRGTGHVQGGIGELAWALVKAFEDAGGQAFFADGVERLDREGRGWVVTSRRRVVRAKRVIANVLPQTASALVGDTNSTVIRLSEQVASGWSAAMLYLTVKPDAPRHRHAHHLELVARNDQPFVEGNHLFVSVGGTEEARDAPDGLRSVTISTHIPMPAFTAMSADDQGEYVATVQQRMRQTLALRAPEIAAGIELEMTGSPRTFERFTQRPMGYVGGIPRRAGLQNYRNFLPAPLFDGLYLVGDTVFPGQSTLAAAIGGLKVANAVGRSLRLPPSQKVGLV